VSYQDKICPQYYSCSAQEHSCNPIDSDNDAFSDYLEIQTGTDRYNPDSDGDTVLDGYDNHPLHEYLPRDYNYYWRYGREWLILTKKFEFNISVSEDVVASYEEMPKDKLISREDPQLKEVAQIMNQLANAEGYNDADKLMMVIAFSRSFNYDYTKADFNKPLPDWANFPMETIVKKQGLCADSAVMAVALLKEMGYDAYYLSGPCDSPSGSWHAIVGITYVNGITLDGLERYVIYNGKNYYYVDATSSDYSGSIFYSTTSKDDFGTTFCPMNEFEVRENY
jgi:transglutaminase-like putative cysteine protease